MKNYITFTVLFVLLSTISFAENKVKSSNGDKTSTEVIYGNQDNTSKWNIRADTWIIDEGRWFEYKQLIRICWSREKGLYMFSIGGITTSVSRSDKRGYDYMVNEPRGKWRFYFNRSDLR